MPEGGCELRAFQFGIIVVAFIVTFVALCVRCDAISWCNV